MIHNARALVPLCLLLLLLAGPFASVDAAEPAPPAPHAHGTNPTSDPPEVEKLGQRLRCPVCQGMPIGESPAPMAQDMMKQVRRMWQEGRSDPEIEKYFTDRFGTWVLLDPPRSGIGLWVWLLPPLCGGAALLYALRRVLRADSNEVLPPIVDGLGIAAGAPARETSEATEDALAAIRKQL